MPVTLPGTVAVTNVDAATDDPKLARADIKSMFDAWNTVRGQVDGLGIMQVGDGVENEAQGAGVKDKLRVKLDGTSTVSGLARSANGLKVADQGVTPAMMQYGGTTGQVWTSRGTATTGTWSTPATGETNDGTNVGTGVQVLKSKGTGTNIPARSLLVNVNNANSGSGSILTNVAMSGSWSQNTDELLLNLTLTRTYVESGGGT